MYALVWCAVRILCWVQNELCCRPLGPPGGTFIPPEALSWEQGAGSWEQGAGSWVGAGSWELGAGYGIGLAWSVSAPFGL